ncbi:unnamed protein product [Prunus brigantina]
MVDTRRTKSNATTTGPSHGFVVETSMQPQGIVAASTLQPSPSALQPPSAVGIAEQLSHDPVTSTAMHQQAQISGAALSRHPTGAALPRYPAIEAQQQQHHSTAGTATHPHGYFDTIPILK